MYFSLPKVSQKVDVLWRNYHKWCYALSNLLQNLAQLSGPGFSLPVDQEFCQCKPAHSKQILFCYYKGAIFYAVFCRFWWHVLPEWTMSTESKKLFINCQIFMGIIYNMKVAYPLFPKISNRCQFISGSAVLPGDFIVKANNSGKFLEWFFRHDWAENGSSYFVIPQIINGFPVTAINSSQNPNPDMRLDCT